MVTDILGNEHCIDENIDTFGHTLMNYKKPTTICVKNPNKRKKSHITYSYRLNIILRGNRYHNINYKDT